MICNYNSEIDVVWISFCFLLPLWHARHALPPVWPCANRGAGGYPLCYAPYKKAMCAVQAARGHGSRRPRPPPAPPVSGVYVDVRACICICASLCSESHAAGPAWVPTCRFQCPQVCIKGAFAKKSGPPRPSVGPPALGFLVRSAERSKSCLARAINWPFRWPAPATHQPAPGDTQGNGSRQLAGAVVLGGWSCTRAATRGQRALLRFCFNSST
jgi:hypothetical protein